MKECCTPLFRSEDTGGFLEDMEQSGFWIFFASRIQVWTASATSSSQVRAAKNAEHAVFDQEIQETWGI
jgi:hypothetical protein